MTEKIEPDDVDVVLAIKSGIMETPEQLNVLDRVARQDFQFPIKCDSYVHLQYPQSHANYWFGEFMNAYWIRQFGFDRTQAMKGIAVIETPII
ncbi:MAG: hypothetical protein AB7G15_14315 [Alphaproteobacteria bacterium]